MSLLILAQPSTKLRRCNSVANALHSPFVAESLQDIDAFVDAMQCILHEANNCPERVTGAPHDMPVKRLDDVKAARELDLSLSK